MDNLNDKVNQSKIRDIRYCIQTAFDTCVSLQNRTYNKNCNTQVAVSKVIVALDEVKKEVDNLQNMLKG